MLSLPSRFLIFVAISITVINGDRLNQLLDSISIKLNQPRLRGPIRIDYKELYAIFNQQFNSDIKQPEENILSSSRGEGRLHRSFEAFVNNTKEIIGHNAKFMKGEVTYKKKIHKYGDIPRWELQKMCTVDIDQKPFNEGNYVYKKDVSDGLLRGSRYIDWRDRGVLPPIKYQGSCGSCYAFAVVATVEAQLALRDGYVTLLSEQQIVDCNEATLGCRGGYLDYTADYVLKEGLMAASDYPYIKKRGVCKGHWSKAIVKPQIVEEIPNGDEGALINLLQRTPVAIAMHTSKDFYEYASGIFSDGSCPQRINHAMALVGFGIENGREYFLLRNSHGEWFGEDGYVKIDKETAEKCGMLKSAVAPLLDSDETDTFDGEDGHCL
ncbi:hypothetical protein ACOME3_000848 [Neoechinorhynchus agilis]